MKAKLRYGCRIAGVMMPAETEVDVLSAFDGRVRAIWPNLKASSDSSQVAVQFANVPTPTLVHVSELSFDGPSTGVKNENNWDPIYRGTQRSVSGRKGKR